MRTYIIYILFLFPLLVIAQNDSVSIRYSEEKVENFEKTTLIDEYEKAFGNNRVVKSSLRISLAGIPTTYISRNHPYPIKDFIRSLDPIIQFEQKISADKSLIVNFSSNRAKDDLFWNSNIGLEGRWYYEMKKRVAQGKQQPNITGKYLSLKAEINPYRVNPRFGNFYDFGFGSGYIVFRETSTYRVNWGWQLGNNVSYWVSAGVKLGDRGAVDNEGFWIDTNFSGKTATTWFISSNAQAGLGLLLPFNKRTANNFCDFLQCNYEVKQLFKVNLNNMLYIDSYLQALGVDVAYERKIGRSPFSINSNIKSGFFNRVIHAPTGAKIDSIFNNAGMLQGWRTRQTFATETDNFWAYNFELAEQLRYYIGMKNRIVKGKSANNLNGLYVGVLGSYKVQNQWIHSFDGNNSVSIVDYNTKELSGGLSVGYQLQTNRRSFLDISTDILRQRTIHPANNQNPGRGINTNTIINFSLKLGFAR
ncbi:hypothetical protein [Emticicia sp. BO119]|uniref:hypothetical protein n=1 Tax=Emticicia sp. BO119 TaxID=2757768 RepID=UPI0015EFF50D|nr:hypothetical protein [Emticicia sp. BO119]MBA4853123.1 hypothetical protein [Emticicia sp. BO119]